MAMNFPKDYPWSPPSVQFITKVYHPNIDYTTGEICISLLDKDNTDETGWRPAQNIASLMVLIQSFFMDPNVDDPMNVRIAAEFKKNRKQFEDTARKWTQKYAIDGEEFRYEDWNFRPVSESSQF
jgi:ubiquitin-conjugating enzyme E2 D/E